MGGGLESLTTLAGLADLIPHSADSKVEVLVLSAENGG